MISWSVTALFSVRPGAAPAATLTPTSRLTCFVRSRSTRSASRQELPSAPGHRSRSGIGHAQRGAPSQFSRQSPHRQPKSHGCRTCRGRTSLKHTQPRTRSPQPSSGSRSSEGVGSSPVTEQVVHQVCISSDFGMIHRKRRRCTWVCFQQNPSQGTTFRVVLSRTARGVAGSSRQARARKF